MIVLDSSFLVAFHNTRDVHHEAAEGAMARLLAGEWGEALLPEYVFLEVSTVLAARRELAVAVSVGETLLQAKEVELVPCAEVFYDAFGIFRAQGDRGLSFADCGILAVARLRGARYVATFDSGFRDLAEVTVVPEAG